LISHNNGRDQNNQLAMVPESKKKPKTESLCVGSGMTDIDHNDISLYERRWQQYYYLL